MGRARRGVSLPRPFLKRVRQELAESVPCQAKVRLSRVEFTEEERAFLAQVIAVIDQHAAYMKETV